MSDVLADLVALSSVVVIDLALAGDNAVVVGMIAAGVPPEQRRKVIAIGIAVAMACRIAFAVVAVQLLAIVGLLLAGGLLLLWVAWKMWREMHPPAAKAESNNASQTNPAPAGSNPAGQPPKTFFTAIVQIGAADISMSLDNVLAVAGTARHNVWILAFGLFLSVLLMGVAAGFVARVITGRPWLNYLGIAIVAAVALSMIYEGGHQVLAAM